MKKIGILTLAALLFVGLAACEKKADGGEGDGDATTTTTTNNNATANNANNTNAANNNNATPAPSLPLTAIEFGEDSHNFGEIKEGDKVSHVFKFKNTGNNPLKVENVKPSCGCTTPDWTKDEIPPGGEGFVKVEFDSKGKSGVQKKSVTVRTNTDPANKILNFTGEVI